MFAVCKNSYPECSWSHLFHWCSLSLHCIQTVDAEDCCHHSSLWAPLWRYATVFNAWLLPQPNDSVMCCQYFTVKMARHQINQNVTFLNLLHKYYVTCKTTYSRRPRRSHPGSRPGRHSVDSSPHTVLWSTGSGSLGRLVHTWAGKERYIILDMW